MASPSLALMEQVAALVEPGADADYFAIHRVRFALAVDRVMAIVPPPARLLDLGSHYLHQAAALRLAGYEVTAVDVPEFHELDFVKRRAQALGIVAAPSSRIASGEFLAGESDAYDVVLFCEIMEHITFNPIEFWRRVHQLLAPGGSIYLTTPNGLAAMEILSTLRRALTLQGIGVDVPSILGEVTYGHHWKLYSAREIRQYFAALSPDFQVAIRPYAYREYQYRMRFGDQLRRAIRALGNRTDWFAEELEAVVTVPAKTAFTAVTPAFG